MDNRTEPLVPGVWRIETGTFVNAYLIARDGSSDADGLLLLDTGGPRSGPRLVRSIRMLGFDPTRIDEVLLTHWHRDHAGSAARFAASSAEPEVRAGRADLPVVADGRAPGSGRGTHLGRLLQPRLPRPAPTPATALDAGEPACPGAHVIAAPGHTLGHRALWLPEHGALLAGDAVYNLWRLSIGPTSLISDLDAVPKTLAELSRLDPAVLACGHGPPVRSRAGRRLGRLADQAAARL